jgi:hypothetical protein
VRFNDHLTWNTSLAFQAIDILGEEFQQQASVVQQLDERVRYRRSKFPGVKLVRESVKGERILSEV